MTRARAYIAILTALVRHLEQRQRKLAEDGVAEPDFLEGFAYAIKLCRGFLRGTPIQPERRRAPRPLRPRDDWPSDVDTRVFNGRRQ